ncbi:MAG: hypothetical protein KC547_04575 [Anaerolineae bacterium]|nr:hypothetical protein [Anaerolineae bacterium]
MEYTNQQTPVTAHEDSPMLMSPTSGLRMLSAIVAIGTALALYTITRRKRRPKTLRDRLEDKLSSGRDSVSQAVDSLEREVRQLRRAVEERLNNA